MERGECEMAPLLIIRSVQTGSAKCHQLLLGKHGTGTRERGKLEGFGSYLAPNMGCCAWTSSVLGTNACAFVPQRCSVAAEPAWPQPPGVYCRPSLQSHSLLRPCLHPALWDHVFLETRMAANQDGGSFKRPSLLCPSHPEGEVSLGREQGSCQTEAGSAGTGVRGTWPRLSCPGVPLLQSPVSCPGIQDAHMRTHFK